MREEEYEVLENGAKQSKLSERFDLIPPVSIQRLAEVFAYGATKYAENNWHGIPLKSHLNHLIRHVYLHLAGDTSEDHLEHALCRAAMAVWAKENGR